MIRFQMRDFFCVKLREMLYLQTQAFSGAVLAFDPTEAQQTRIRTAQVENLRWGSAQLVRLGVR
jgi:hypothetical protein